MSDPDPWCTAMVHGDARAYSHHRCRCNAARASNSKDKNLWKLRSAHAPGGHLMVPILGTQRRLRALAAEGWTFEVLADALGPERYHRNLVGRWARGGEKLYATSALEVTELYLALESMPGPSRRAALRAAEKGWVGPDRWFEVDMDDPAAGPHPEMDSMGYISDIDEVVVARLVAGDRPTRANRHERREAIRTLWACGLTTSEIARRCGWDDRIVSRDLAWLYERGLAKRRLRVALSVEHETVVFDRARPPRL